MSSSSFYFPISYEDDEQRVLTQLRQRKPASGQTYDEWQPAEGRQRRVVSGMSGRWKPAFSLTAPIHEDVILLGVWGYKTESDEKEETCTFNPGVGGQVVVAAMMNEEATHDKLREKLHEWMETTPEAQSAHRLFAQAVQIKNGEAKLMLVPGIYDSTCHEGMWTKDLLHSSGLDE